MNGGGSALPLEDLGAMREAVWDLLEAGAADRRAPFHLVQLASLDAEGAPDARTVVLRGADRGAGVLRFHTDARSPKAAQIAADPRLAVLAYEPELGLQLRIAGRGVVLDGAEADAAWADCAPPSRVCYRARFAPSAAIDAPGEADPGGDARSPADPDAGRENFRLVAVTVERLEWLHLAAGGHRRAVYLGAGDWRGQWLAP